MSLSALLDESVIERFDRWQRSLIFESKSRDADPAAVESRQRDLAEAVNRGPAAVCDFVLDALGWARHEVEPHVPALPNPLTPAEMSQLPICAERKIARHLERSISPTEAAEPAAWTICHAIWMHRGMFGRDLARVFLQGGARGDAPEARTRNFLRRTGGLRLVRGNISPLVDCPVAAAFWRYRCARLVSDICTEESGVRFAENEAHGVLHAREVWENLARMSLQRIVAVSEPRAQAAVVFVLHGALEADAQRPSGQAALRPKVMEAVRA
ncbi:MAG: hypothetical protein OXH52_14550, partial [Gammaproteobacteria bacterium]|nr:hypothetical protein [Gammaproteobacteria bacterium]